MSVALQIYRGRATTYQLDIKRNGLALSLAGQTLTWTASRLQDQPASAAAIRKVTGESITHSAVTGRAFFTITPAEAAALDPLVTFYCDAAIEDEAGNPVAIEDLEGTLTALSVATEV